MYASTISHGFTSSGSNIACIYEDEYDLEDRDEAQREFSLEFDDLIIKGSPELQYKRNYKSDYMVPQTKQTKIVPNRKIINSLHICEKSKASKRSESSDDEKEQNWKLETRGPTENNGIGSKKELLNGRFLHPFESESSPLNDIQCSCGYEMCANCKELRFASSLSCLSASELGFRVTDWLSEHKEAINYYCLLTIFSVSVLLLPMIPLLLFVFYND